MSGPPTTAAPAAAPTGAAPSASPAPASPPPAASPSLKRKGSRTGLFAIIGVIIVVVIVVAVGFETNWFGLKSSSGPSTVTCSTGVTLQGEGASFFTVLMSQWQQSFAGSTQNMVNYEASGAGAGVTALADKTVDFAATDEALNASEVAAMPGPTYTFPVTGGPLAIVYNVPGLAQPLNLTGLDLAAIYNGSISHWNDPRILANNPSAPNQPIYTVVRSDAAGTSYVFTDFLSAASPKWASTVGASIQPTWPKPMPNTQHAIKGNSGVAQFVAGNQYTIGYVDLADAIAAKDAYATVQNPSGNFIWPTQANTQAAINNLSKGATFPGAGGNWSGVTWINSKGTYDYPLALITYFIVLQNPGLGHTATLQDAQVLLQWLRWVSSSTAQGYAANLYYISPPSALLSQNVAALGSMNFNGESIAECST